MKLEIGTRVEITGYCSVGVNRDIVTGKKGVVIETLPNAPRGWVSVMLDEVIAGSNCINTLPENLTPEDNEPPQRPALRLV